MIQSIQYRLRLTVIGAGLSVMASITTPILAQDSAIIMQDDVTTLRDGGEGPMGSSTTIGPSAPEATIPDPFNIAVPSSALKDEACPDQFAERSALTLAQLNALSLEPDTGPLSDAVCFGSAWRISKGDGVRQPTFTLAFSPNQTVCEDGSCTGRQFKSEVKLGLDALASDGATATGWFLFAGADDKAVMWRTRNDSALAQENRLVLEDSLTVGDVEAGVSYVHKRGEVAVSYIHRETSYRVDQEQKLSDTEGYVGVVFRLK